MQVGAVIGGAAWRMAALMALVGVGTVIGYYVFGPSAKSSGEGLIGGAQAAKSNGAVAVGAVSGLALPRYVSLKSDQVNVRGGPGKDHDVLWSYHRAGLPVEIMAEWDNWRRVRDAEGSEGWIFHSLLSGRRTALVAPWSKDAVLPLRKDGAGDASVVAQLQPKVLANVATCTGSWCRIFGDGFDGWIEQDKLFGVYPDEVF